jgi:hypothetical protein
MLMSCIPLYPVYTFKVPEWCSNCRQIACCSYMLFNWLWGRKYGTVWYHPASSRFYLTVFILCQFQGKLTGTLQIQQHVLSQLVQLAVWLVWGADFTSTDCLREDQDTKEDPKNWQVPEVDFLSNRHPAKSASENPWSAKEENTEYQRTKSGVWRKYRNMRFTACWWEVLGDAWKRAHRHTENWMSGLVAVK